MDEDPAPPPRPTAASVDRARPVAASVGVACTSLPYASVDTRRPGSAAVGPRLLEPATSVFAGASSVAARPGSLDVASSRTHVRSDTPMPMNDVGQRMRVDVPRPLDLTLLTAGDDVVQLYAPWSTASDVPPGNVDVAGSAYDPASLTVLDIACEPGTSSIVAPMPTAASVHRPTSTDVGLPRRCWPISSTRVSGAGPAEDSTTSIGTDDLGGRTPTADIGEH